MRRRNSKTTNRYSRLKILAWKRRSQYLSGLFLICTMQLEAQTLDTLLDVGGNVLHFRILKGEGVPVLFEAGAGDELTVWDTILPQISSATGTTLITYERAGFGSSRIDPADTVLTHQGILRSVSDLETALSILGYDREIMLVAHSYGGYVSALYARRYPERIKTAVLIDVNHDFYFGNDFLEKEMRGNQAEIDELNARIPGFRYLSGTISNTVTTVGRQTIPDGIPVADVVSDIGIFPERKKNVRWKKCHAEYVKNHSSVRGVLARNCHHYVWMDNPELITSIIIEFWSAIGD